MIRYEKDIDNIVTLTLDMQGRKENILNHEITAALEPVLEHLKKEKARRALKGVVITSNKKTFLAGGDLEYLYQCQDPKEMFEYTEKINRFLRDLERPGVPVVAAINGSALGMGFELALACHHRIVLNRPEIKLGFPEIKVGLIPGNGGIIRLMWLLGIRKAFPILEKGHRYLPLEALEVGMVDELAENKREMIEKAKAWLKSEKEGRRKWDTEYGTIPGGTAREMRVAMEISRLSAHVAARYRGNFPAPQAILNILSEASKVDFDTATRIESRYYSDLLCRPESKNMIKTFWMEYRQIKSGINR
ncbi:MAG: enoyl-CoA hydratase/isomerase family protein, partial [Bacteroidota bacterium]